MGEGGMFTLGQLVEKRVEKQENMALGFTNFETACDTVLKEMSMATLRWMAIPEADVRMVEGTYEETVKPGISEEISVEVGVREDRVRRN